MKTQKSEEKELKKTIKKTAKKNIAKNVDKMTLEELKEHLALKEQSEFQNELTEKPKRKYTKKPKEKVIEEPSTKYNESSSDESDYESDKEKPKQLIKTNEATVIVKTVRKKKIDKDVQFAPPPIKQEEPKEEYKEEPKIIREPQIIREQPRRSRIAFY